MSNMTQKYRIICPDNDEIVARPRTRKAALTTLQHARQRHTAELYELERQGWRHCPIPEAPLGLSNHATASTTGR